MSKIILGSHIGLSSPEYYLGTVKEALSYGEDTFMFYTGAPQNTFRKPLSELWIEQGRKLIKESNIDESKIVVHAPYIINLGNNLKPDTYDLAISFLAQEIRRVAGFGLKLLVLHPGSHLKNGEENGLISIVDGLNKVLDADDSDVIICLETMAGKGSELGVNFEFLAKVIEGVHKKDRVAVCLDTCHINDAGYDINKEKEIIDEFDRIIGLDKLKVIHLNDSKNPMGAHKDRHENIGYGFIGFENLLAFVYDERLADIPKILETPYVNGKPPYKEEIEMIRAKTLTPNWKDKY